MMTVSIMLFAPSVIADIGAACRTNEHRKKRFRPISLAPAGTKEMHIGFLVRPRNRTKVNRHDADHRPADAR
jgi:hypothetical protein